jgi:hypothetical protein
LFRAAAAAGVMLARERLAAFFAHRRRRQRQAEARDKVSNERASGIESLSQGPPVWMSPQVHGSSRASQTDTQNILGKLVGDGRFSHSNFDLRVRLGFDSWILNPCDSPQRQRGTENT